MFSFCFRGRPVVWDVVVVEVEMRFERALLKLSVVGLGILEVGLRARRGRP